MVVVVVSAKKIILLYLISNWKGGKKMAVLLRSRPLSSQFNILIYIVLLGRAVKKNGHFGMYGSPTLIKGARGGQV